MQEKERRAWRSKNGIPAERAIEWGVVFKKATEEQLGRREVDCNLVAAGEQPRRIHFSKEEIYHLDHEGQYWDEMSGKMLNQEEAIAARLDEIKQLHVHDVYEKVPEEDCWKSTGRRPVQVKWIDINKGDLNEPEYQSRLVAQ